MDRRKYLTRLGAGLTVGTAGLAGCTSPGAEEATEEAGTEAGGEETETEVMEATETEAMEATETEADGTPTDTVEAGDTETAGNESAGGAGGGENQVAMLTDGDQYIFDPIGLYVEPGATVTWVNESGSHSSAAYVEGNPQAEVNRIPEGAEGWDSGILSESGAEFTHTFETEGTYDYYCTPHKTLGMVGRIVVGEPSGLEGDPPDGAVPSEQRIVEEGPISAEEFEG
ncbi:plastocyanin/azurin family copper-binding protein [Halomicrobium salinisoli]|uniref:plastocyanin/azurin family copper-binding protein n=1 Tax=Halomicrobium salinisoli TaxID=2878391 RepID=UPI001CF0D00B|nr:plastocyanin/azurin family copper-binding protein [Halomicrobium salinisoli]